MVSIGSAFDALAAEVVNVLPPGSTATRERKAAKPHRFCDHI
jgi:hypothetical protein